MKRSKPSLSYAKSGIDFWGPVVHEELYNLAEDPEEKENVLASSGQRKIVLKKILTDYESTCKRLGQAPNGTPTPDEKLSPEEIKRLRALGYL